jgi:transposase
LNKCVAQNEQLRRENCTVATSKLDTCIKLWFASENRATKITGGHKMTNYREILRLRSLGLTNSRISEATLVSRTTVIRALTAATAVGLDYATVVELSDRELAKALFPRDENSKPTYATPDYEWVHQELAKPHVTQELLWGEYCEKCRDAGTIPYQLTQFKKYYREWAAQTKATMHLNRKPGELMEVDWAGQTTTVIDDETGEPIDAYVFVAALPYSGFGYIEAFWNREQPSWIAAHVNAYEYFGGVTRILVPDNLKTGVTKHTKKELVLNRSYQEMAEHYGTAIIPTRVRTPKDKATVEGTVGIISTYILAAIRNQKFFSLAELNTEIRERLHKFNHKPFQRKDGSRASLFAEERQFLLPLPVTPFELSEWKKATVQFNYHVLADSHYYSVPYEYIKREVDVRLTRNVIEVFYGGSRICSHVRLYGKRELYSTADEHMPPNHQEYAQWSGARFRSWAAKIGSNTAAIIETILTGCKVEQQGYRTCMALLNLSKQFSEERLEAVCARALDYTPRPSFKTIQTMLKSGRDKAENEPQTTSEVSKFSFTRGSEYYKGGRGDAE